MTERKQLEMAITRMALEDPLTGLANRRLFSDRLNEAVARSSGAGGVSAVLFIDLDGFKDINDITVTPPATPCFRTWHAA